MRQASQYAVFFLLLVATACQPALDDPEATLKIPATVPDFALEPKAPSLTQRATELADEATVALAKNDVKQAIPLLTEALAIDVSHERARWLLARTFAQAGRASVALRLFEPLAKHLHDCGWCLETLQNVQKDSTFARLVASKEGHALLEKVPTTPLPYQTWAQTLAKQIQTGKLEEVGKFANAHRPFELVRACPGCTDPQKRLPQHRQFTGSPLLIKVASRFDLTRPENYGMPLQITGDPQCTERCCHWPIAQSIQAGTAALQEICLRPDTPTQPSVTRMSLIFGPGTVTAH